MALRSLDNALPITTTERPKKNKKIVSLLTSSKTKSDVAVNDENKAPIPPTTTTTADATIDYISSQNLKPLSDPDTKIKEVVEGLESKDWIKMCDSLNTARRIALYHSHLLLPILEKVMAVLVNAMKNPRSALIKTSIMASSDLFTAYGDRLLETNSSSAAAFDQLLLQLLLKASQDKKFVCEEAEKAVKAMVECMTPLLLLHKFRAYVAHSNPRIRAKAALFMSASVSNSGIEGMKEFGLAPLIQLSADLLNDRLPETREAARCMVGSVYEAVTEKEEEEDKKHESWQAFCQANLSALNALSVAKVVVPAKQ